MDALNKKCEFIQRQIHKIINGSLAQRDGRMRKGDRIVSINGHLLKGVTHRKALEIMKCLRPEIVLVIARPTEVDTDADQAADVESKDTRDVLITIGSTDRSTGAESIVSQRNDLVDMDNLMDNIYKANLIKDGAALGFILEGGKDSPLGDRPLAIKRIFKGKCKLYV